MHIHLQFLVYFCLLMFTGAAMQTARAIVLTTNNPMSTGRLAHTAILLMNGKVLVVGGIGTGPTTNVCELYDPATGTWANTGPLNTARNQNTATLLLNGKVLVTAGSANSGFTNNCELYDPVTGTWSYTGSLTTSRNQHTATLLPSGKVLVTGGAGASILSSVEIYDPATGVWSAGNPLTTGVRHSHTATLLTNGLVLVAGGNNGSVSVATSELFNPATGTWTATVGPMASARFRHTATLLPNGKVLVATGGNGGFLKTSELFNPATGTWTAIANPLFEAHADSSAVLLPNGRVLLAGGFSSVNTPTTIAEAYDPNTNGWSAFPSLVTARYYNTVTLLANGKVLVAGGNPSTGVTTTTELFDVTTGFWAVTNALTNTRANHAAILLPNGKVLVAGGTNSGGVTGSSEIFDPNNSTWTASSPLAAARSQHTLNLLVNGKVLVTGGFNGTNPTNSAELYDPAIGTWASTSAMTNARYAHTATTLPNGRVLVAGGQGLTSVTNSAEIYNPISGTWTNTGSLGTARKNHTATLLQGIRILVVGGTNSSGSLASAEQYDVNSGTWSATTTAPLTARSLHTATLLPNGKVLVAGGIGNGITNGAELYTPATGTWTNTGSMLIARHSHTAMLLPNGKVLVSGGLTASGATNVSEVYDPAFGTWSATTTLTNARYNFTATLLPNSKVLVTGGQGTNGITNSVEVYDLGLGYTNTWQPQITNYTGMLVLGSNLVLNGSQFRGVSEGGGGSMLDSSGDYPVVQLRNIESGQTLSLNSTNWNTNSFTSLSVQTNFPQGYALATMYVNAIPGTSSILYVGKPVATVTMTNLGQTYDGMAKTVGATTVPTGLSMIFTYNGSLIAPTNAGSYTVIGTVNDVNYQGTATNTLVVSNAIATVTLFNLSQTYDGTAKSVNFLTVPNSLTVNLTYNGLPNAPTNAGTYTVIGTVNDPNYIGSTTNTLTVNKATTTVSLSNLNQTYDGTAKTATVLTTPPGLAVDVTYNASPNAPTNAGSYTVMATINDINYQGTAFDTLLINKAAATVTLGNLAQTYDGSLKNVTVTTAPPGLSVLVTYNGSGAPPSNAGSYIVVGTISDVNYQGGSTNTLVIAKAVASVTLNNLSQAYDGTAKSVTASTTPGSLTVNITYNGSASAPTNAGSYTVVGIVSDANYQGGATNTLFVAKIAGTVTLGSLSQTYNGSVRNATASTTPSGLTVAFTYNGSPSAPVNAGSYTVVGLINDVNYFGGATNTLVVSQALATVNLGSLIQIYDGTARVATATPTPNGLTVSLTYNGLSIAPTNVGSYTVAGIVSDANYYGGATNTLVVSKAASAVALNNLAQTYDGTARIVTATTTPNGLTVNITYNGSVNAPTNAGSYTVVGIINEANYFGGATNTLVVAKATAIVALGSLSQTYDGTAKSATATTTPGGLTVTNTYDGSANAPTNAGSYAVVGTINEANYQGTGLGALVIAKAAATVTLSNLTQKYDGTVKRISVITAPTNLAVIVTYNGVTNEPVSLGNYTVIGVINELNYQGSATNTLTINCPTITVNALGQSSGGLNAAYSQTITASGGSAPYVFTRVSGSLPSGLTLSTNGLLAGTPTASGVFNFTVMAVDTNGCSGSRLFTFVVVPPPTITTPPQSQTILPGGTANLSVTATGGGLNYQWRLNGTNISGAVLATLGLTKVSAADVGHYTVVVSNAGGSVTSAPAILTLWSVNFYPVVTVIGQVGDQYRIDYNADLNTTNWNVLGTVTLPFSPYYFVDTNSPGPDKRFYRVVLP